MTRSSRRSWPVRARRGGGGTRDWQLAAIVAGSRAPGREEDTEQAARPRRGWCAHAGREGVH